MDLVGRGEVTKLDKHANQELGALRPVYLEAVLPAVQRHALHQSWKAEEMVTVEMCDEYLANLHEWTIEILQNLGEKQHNIPIVLLGNKSDLQQKLLIEQDAISKFKDELRMQFHADSTAFMYTSALSGMNIEESFEVLGLLLLKKKNPNFSIDKTPNKFEYSPNVPSTRPSNA